MTPVHIPVCGSVAPSCCSVVADYSNLHYVLDVDLDTVRGSATKISASMLFIPREKRRGKRRSVCFSRDLGTAMKGRRS